MVAARVCCGSTTCIRRKAECSRSFRPAVVRPRCLQHFFRDFRTGHEHPLDTGLFDLLHEVAVTLDRDPEFEVICGYRSPKTNEYLRGRSASSGVAQRSLHLEGRAVDVRMVGVSVERLHTAGLSLQRGGAGLYTASQFVHFDTGRVRHWGS